ncbi:MAG: aminoacyl-tRNA hydrolase [Planctomycetota bacterium]
MQPALGLVVGLGNPGPEYTWTRHNVGFLVLDELARRQGLLFQRPNHLNGYTGPRGFDWALLTEPAGFLLKPGTYMNRSGEVLAPLARWLARRGEPTPPAPGLDQTPAVDPSRILVVYDDMDLEPGRLRIRPHGGAGGHNGMRSIIERLGTDRFPRLRVGVGRPATDAARHVLEPIPEREREGYAVSFMEAADAVLAWLSGETLEDVMTRFHSRWNAGA